MRGAESRPNIPTILWNGVDKPKLWQDTHLAQDAQRRTRIMEGFVETALRLLVAELNEP